ncbi:MAG: hypothetical protein ACR2LQ_03155 [Acidimicrobiales bacterium]
MTEHDDELVSVAIDGEATPDEAAQVAADPRLAARRAVMQAAAELGATPVAPSPPEARDAAIAAALAAHDVRDGIVTSLAARRPGRSMRWVGAAAAALLVIAGATLLLRARDSDPTSTVASRAEPSSTSPGFANRAGAPDGTAAGPTAADAAGAESLRTATDLGTFASNAELTDAIRRLVFGGPLGATSIPSTSSTTAVGCPAPLTLASIEFVATALLEGRELLIFVGHIESGELVYLALDATCATSFTQSLG